MRRGGAGARDRATRRRERARSRAHRRPRSAVGRPWVRRVPPASRGGALRSRGTAGEEQRVIEKTIKVDINGDLYERDVEARRLLVHFIRDDLELTGTHVGCDTGNCGACTILYNGDAIKSCMMLAIQADGATIQTIEALAHDGQLHPLQQAFSEEHALQCGYCTPGMLMAAKYLLDRNPQPTEQEVREAIQGNICRCTGYWNIIDAVMAAASRGEET